MEPKKLWKVFCAARYKDGHCLEDFDMSHMSSGQPHMIELEEYISLLKYCKQLEEEINILVEKLDECRRTITK